MSTTASGGAGKAGHVILFSLDGCRPDALGPEASPTIWALRDRGASCLTAQTVVPSVTLPCHTALFFSLPPSRHGVMTNDWIPFSIAPSLTEVINDAGYSTMAFYMWEPLRDLAAPGTLDLVFYRRYSDGGMSAVVDAAVTTLRSAQPTFTFVYLEATDAEGHRFGWMSPEYMAAVAECDAGVAAVLQAAAETGMLEQTVVVVLADHGGHGHGHGTEMPEDMTIPVIFSGAGVRQGHALTGPVSILDVAPTVLACLGLSAPDAWEGRAVTEALVGR